MKLQADYIAEMYTINNCIDALHTGGIQTGCHGFQNLKWEFIILMHSKLLIYFCYPPKPLTAYVRANFLFLTWKSKPVV